MSMSADLFLTTAGVFGCMSSGMLVTNHTTQNSVRSCCCVMAVAQFALDFAFILVGSERLDTFSVNHC